MVLFACNNSAERNTESIGNKKGGITIKSSTKLDSINVIALNESYNQEPIELYNIDGSLWKSFKLTDDFKDTSLNIITKSDYSLLIFECIGRKASYYAVRGNNQTKYIKANLKYFDYDTWEKHIVKVTSVDFDPKKNPIRTDATIQSKIISYNNEEIYSPVEVKGKWLKIIDNKENIGWIQWVDNNGNLLVSLIYLC